jgi:TRAP-type C4-dicarboxylate transport system permease large subunit
MLAPTFYELGIDPIHFGMIACVNLTIGLATPPFGLVLFAVCGIAKLSLARVSLSILPFLLSEIFALLMVTYVPFFTLHFPKMFGFVK